MATGISAWAQGIIIAVIVGSIIQMLLPENKNKKYIKVVIGIYILFSILSPIVGKNLSLDDYNFDNYLLIDFVGRWHKGIDLNMNYYSQE